MLSLSNNLYYQTKNDHKYGNWDKRNVVKRTENHLPDTIFMVFDSPVAYEEKTYICCVFLSIDAFAQTGLTCFATAETVLTCVHFKLMFVIYSPVLFKCADFCFLLYLSAKEILPGLFVDILSTGDTLCDYELCLWQGFTAVTITFYSFTQFILSNGENTGLTCSLQMYVICLSEATWTYPMKWIEIKSKTSVNCYSAWTWRWVTQKLITTWWEVEGIYK